MGLRFRRSIRLLPGVRLNLSRSGVSATLGAPGATLNVGRRSALTLGIPGTGLSYRRSLPRRSRTPARSGRSAGWVVLVLVVVALFAWGRRPAGQGAVPVATPATPLASLPQAAPEVPMLVTATRANCRARPSPRGRVVRRLARGVRLTPLGTRAGWQKVEAGGRACWMSAALLASAGAETSAQAPSSRVPSRM